MKQINWAKEVPIWIILLAPAVFYLLYKNSLPEQVPVHFNLQGEADRMGSPLVFLGLNILLYLLFLFLPAIDPRKKNYENFKQTYYYLRLGMALFMSVFFSLIMAQALGMEIPFPRIILVTVMGLLTFLGAILPRLKSNWFIGIRTPWTLESDEVWHKTHALAGPIWTWCGILGLLVVLFFPVPQYLGMVIAVLVAVMALVPMVYSYMLYKKLKAGKLK